jgi:hypothetical protein
LPRTQWAELPEQPRKAVEDRFGTVSKVRSAGPGFTSGIAARLDTEAGTIFLKATPKSDRFAGDCVTEREVNRSLPVSIPTPRILWDAETEDWLLLAFEHLEGRQADLSPGSADLLLVLETLGQVSRALTPCPWQGAPSVAQEVARMRSKTAQIEPDGLAEWADAAAGRSFEALGGDSLLHTDLHSANILIADEVHLLDWALAVRGAAWVEAVLFAARLIESGHSPAEAERLVSELPGWWAAPADAVTGLIAVRTLFAEYLAHKGPIRLRTRRRRNVDAGQAWLRYRASYTF